MAQMQGGPVMSQNMDPSTPSKSTSRSSTKPSMSTLQKYLEQHQMFFQKGTLDKPECADFKETVMGLIDDKRESTMKADSVSKLRSTAAQGAFNNEDTLLTLLLPTIIKESRGTRNLDHHEPDAPEEFTMEEFKNDGLQVAINRLFHRDCLPNSYADIGLNDKDARDLVKHQWITNPKPDRVYGVQPDKYPILPGMQVRSESIDLLDIVPTMHHAFYIIEGKSSNGNMLEAALQALRGTTALIHSSRDLLIQTGQLAEDGGDYGPDANTFVFSSTVDSDLMRFWVTFARVEKGFEGKKYTRYYMEPLISKAFGDDDEALTSVRRICHNILDWGLLDRHEMLEQRCNAIYEFDTKWFREMVNRQRAEREDEEPAKEKAGGSHQNRDGQSPTKKRKQGK